MLFTFVTNFLLFMLGACAASFGDCVGYRIPRHLNWITGHSQCNVCGKKLHPLDLVPVFSCMFLRARCRYCGSYFGWRNFVFELATGLLCIFSTLFIYDFQKQLQRTIIVCIICTPIFIVYELIIYNVSNKKS